MKRLLGLFGVQVGLLVVGALAALLLAPGHDDAPLAVRIIPGDDASSEIVNVFELSPRGDTLTISLFGDPRSAIDASSLFRIVAERDATVVLRAEATGPHVARYAVDVGGERLLLARDAASATSFDMRAGTSTDARVALALDADAPVEGLPVTVTFTAHARSD